MARNWLTQSMLPSKYWYFAVKRAVEVANIMPVTIDNVITTPYYAVYNEKPNYGSLIPMCAVSCGDGFRFDLHSPAGPQFAQQYEGDFIFTTKSAREIVHIKPQHESNAKAYYKDEDSTFQPVRILDVPIDEEIDPYTVQHIETGDILQVMHMDLLDHDPTADPQQLQNNLNVPFPQYPWIKDDAKVTLFLPHLMLQPRQGFLQHESKLNA